MKPDRAARLRTLAAMVRDTKLNTLARTNYKMASLREEIAWINRPATSVSPEDPFARSGADTNWNHWRIMRTAELNRQLALLRADQLEQQSAARRSVSRCEVLQKLKDKKTRR